MKSWLVNDGILNDPWLIIIPILCWVVFDNTYIGESWSIIGLIGLLAYHNILAYNNPYIKQPTVWALQHYSSLLLPSSGLLDVTVGTVDVITVDVMTVTSVGYPLKSEPSRAQNNVSFFNTKYYIPYEKLDWLKKSGEKTM